MPENTSSEAKKKRKQTVPPKNYQIRGVSDDLRARIAGAAGYLEMGKDEFVAELLRRNMERFEQHQKEVKDWWDSWRW